MHFCYIDIQITHLIVINLIYAELQKLWQPNVSTNLFYCVLVDLEVLFFVLIFVITHIEYLFS